ncbi:MAG: DNA recombination protein RmuC [Candidatus Marinimicrobia bacterium]|nr:DNA recombination protein RmuC [Candidatus Neomarinimicrobiota bacterium]
MDIFLLIIMCLTLLIILFLYFKLNSSDNYDINKEFEENIRRFDTSLFNTEKRINDQLQRNRDESNKVSKLNRQELVESLNKFEESFSNRIKDVQDLIYKQLKDIRQDNTTQLEKMRETVDEKLHKTLEKRLGESFKHVSDRLELVHKGLGEMQTIATGVGDLKKVLMNVKTRGVLGEYQLENILEQILTPEQFSKNVSTKEGSQGHVEFAVKMPGKSHKKEVWLPIDSKFPIEPYNLLNDEYERGDKVSIEKARKALIKSMEIFAKDISEKYIDPPNTTDFAIMFLPIEGLYAEAIRDVGLFNTLRSKYNITITGPTTLSALLNSLQMGFRTLAVQERSSEVWKILEAVKTEFDKFGIHLEKVDKQLHTASKSLSDLRVRRSKAMSRKMQDVGSLDSKESKRILEIPEITDTDNLMILDED